jgi:hypothetical protein
MAAVAAVWWLARSIGGPIAGLAAGLLMAVSASAIEESTFIWNPNLVAVSSSVAFAAAWRAWTTWRVRWWLVAAAALAITMQLHVLGAVLLVPFAGLLVADARRTSEADRSSVWQVALAAIAIIVLSYLPLLASELTRGFPETRAVVAFVTAGGSSEPAALNPLVRVVVVAVRALSWPLTGLITTAPIAAIVAAATVTGILAWRARSDAPRERRGVAWFAAILAWSIVALAIAAPSLATVVEGLPNDHYHAFLDPIVFVVAALGIAALWRTGAIGRVAGAATLVFICGFNIATWPPAVASDGGWPAAESAGRRIIASVGSDQIVLLGLPTFKPADAYGYPLARLDHPVSLLQDLIGSLDGFTLVIPCDRLFESVMAARCGGPAEDAAAANLQSGWQLVYRFDASPRTSISIYKRPAGS